MKTLTELRQGLDAAADLVNQIELVRGQILAMGRVVPDAEIMKPAMELEGRLAALEQNLVDLRVTGRGQDSVRFGAQLLGKFSYLANGLASADFRPTAQQLEVQKVLEAKLKDQQAALDALLGKDLKALNEFIHGRGVSNIITTRRPGT